MILYDTLRSFEFLDRLTPSSLQALSHGLLHDSLGEVGGRCVS